MTIKRLIGAALVLVVSASCASAQDFDQVRVETIELADDVYMLSGAGGNVAVLVGDDGVLLIDSMFAELEDRMRLAISRLSQQPVRFVLNTNWHYDHVRGNEAFARTGATIMAHQKARERMTVAQYHPFFDMKIAPYPELALPTITLTDSMTLYLDGEQLHVFHIPAAHSDADLAFYFRNANVLHTGDLFFSAGYPFIDYNHGGGIDGMIAAAQQLADMIDDETKVIPGHGPASSREGLLEYRQMLITIRDRIAAQIREGRSLEEITASKPTSDLDEGRTLGMSPDEIVKIVYDDLSRRDGA